ncbi:hypothetical protein AMST5_02380 [freshwater sediment metagenome]|uniref:Uncharacterized protein n=1 Tax=freshwater sediment metagenome TaxID=556182 RepID=A0AA48LZU9_9ZZZZ
MVRRALGQLGLCLVLAIVAATPSLARKSAGLAWQDMTFAGRCGLFLLSPNGQRVWYRYDLRRWSYGDDRDFSCFILDN